MLLTSSQVSVAISSFIVFIFTTALFLSGYVLQQQTVRDLRAAIQPQLVRERPKPAPELFLPPQFRKEENDEMRELRERMGLVDIVIERDEANGGLNNMKNDGEEDDDMIGATRWQKAARKKKLEEEAQAAKERQSPINKQTSREQKDWQDTTEETEDRQPISRVERRRRIKEQIIAEGEGEGFKGYRRRVW